MVMMQVLHHPPMRQRIGVRPSIPHVTPHQSLDLGGRKISKFKSLLLCFKMGHLHRPCGGFDWRLFTTALAIWVGGSFHSRSMNNALGRDPSAINGGGAIFDCSHKGD